MQQRVWLTFVFALLATTTASGRDKMTVPVATASPATQPAIALEAKPPDGALALQPSHGNTFDPTGDDAALVLPGQELAFEAAKAAAITTGSLPLNSDSEEAGAYSLMRPATKPLRVKPVPPSVVFDLANDEVLYAADPDRLWFPASLTKLMTAYVAFKAVQSGKQSWSRDLTITPKAMLQPAVKVGLRAGQKLPLDGAVKSMIMTSANDLAMAVAETVADTEEGFVAQMNEAARSLGMVRSHFANPSGLPHPQQVSSARDLAVLARALLHEFPEHAAFFAAREAQLGKRRLTTINGLLITFQGADGMKTGFTCAAGYNVVATAMRDGRKIVAVVLGETSRLNRATKAASLLELGFKSPAQAMPFDVASLDQMTLSPALPSEPPDLSRVVRSGACGQSDPDEQAVALKNAGAKLAHAGVHAAAVHAQVSKRAPGRENAAR